MRHAAFALAFSLATAITAAASADVAPRCKCATAGSGTQGVVTAGLLGCAGLVLLAARRRR
jgi:MYXO-CTERM domain-containing protein